MERKTYYQRHAHVHTFVNTQIVDSRDQGLKEAHTTTRHTAMDVGRLPGKALWILVLAGLWYIALPRRSNPGESQGEAKGIELKVLSCNSSTCINGYCASDDTCRCYYGYKGPSCEEERPCNFDTCIHGSCILNDTCICSNGFKGPSCDEVASCNSSTCIHGFCTSDDTCRCYSGFKGPSCNEESPCNTSTCLHGYCTWDEECRCYNGYRVPYCGEESPSNFHYTLYGICSWNYICIHGFCSWNYTCICLNGFKEPSCDKEPYNWDSGWMIGLSYLLTFGFAIILFVCTCCFICCKGCWYCLTSCKRVSSCIKKA